MGPDRRLDEFAARQYGVFSLKQARTVGMTDRMVEGRLGSGAWLRLDSGIYALASSAPRWERQLAAAVLSRPRSVVAGRSAAYLHKFDGFNHGRPVVLVPFEGNGRSPIADVIRSRHFSTIATTRIGAFEVTTPSETIVSVARDLDANRLEELIDHCLASKLVDAETIMATIQRRSGVRGVAALRKVVEGRLPKAYQPPTSVLEGSLYKVLNRQEIPEVTRQFPLPREVVPGTVDAYVHRWRLIIEADGRRWHTRKEDFERDRMRDNLATSHGIAVLRFTYQMLTRSPEQCVKMILETGAIRSRAS